LAPGAYLGNVQREINKVIGDVPLHGATLRWGGQAQALGESSGQLGGALLLSVSLVYILMAALFEAFLSPFIIMFSLPMALVGAILGLLITGKTLSIVSMIGIIMLMGLVTKNAILLVDYTNTLRARGQSRREAILQAGPTRLRPILMTTIAMIAGMLPVAAGIGRGAEFRAPMAVAVIGGLAWSTLLTLLVIPVVYTLIDDLAGWLTGARRRGAAAEPRLRAEAQPGEPQARADAQAAEPQRSAEARP
jgi:HAE1 family hydrophobic/amphiphilic exporter-1